MGKTVVAFEILSDHNNIKISLLSSGQSYYEAQTSIPISIRNELQTQ